LVRVAIGYRVLAIGYAKRASGEFGADLGQGNIDDRYIQLNENESGTVRRRPK
jgi:hypothetical protein